MYPTLKLNTREMLHPIGAALCIIALAVIWTGVIAEDDFLLPDQAFMVSGEAEGPDAVRVRWDIADGYYLYQSKIGFRSLTDGVTVGNPELPAGETKHDDFFGEMEVYRGSVEARVLLTHQPGSEAVLSLEARSQGCADAGLCYPPQRQNLLLELPVLAAIATDAPPAEVVDSAAITPEQTSAPLREQVLGGPDDSGGLGLGFGFEDDLLTAEKAFQFQAEVAAPDRLQLTWDIAPETYLYRDKVQIALEDTAGVALGAFELPAGDIKKDSILPDGSTGDVEVYHGRIDLGLPLRRTSTEPTEITLVAKYQGCAERGICYPPQTQRVQLALPTAAADSLAKETTVSSAATTAAAPAPAAAAPVSEQDRIAEVLKGGNLWVIVLAFFGFGLLLAFTPCVFPMIPILSGIIAGQGSGITTRKAFVLSLVYVLAMAATYTVAGVLAGLFGANLQAAFQNPWILSVFALVFVALALSMFGFYDLQLPSSLQSRITEISNKQEGGTLIGVAIMGFLSALIVGPCVAPPLFGALIYISQTGDAVLGGIALFALSLGMGAPLVAIGTSAGKLLPRAGAWMDAVKAVFGVLLLGVAILLLERILPAAVAMLLWGLLLICSGVYLGALTQLPPEASGWRKLWKGLGVVLLVYGTLMLVGTGAGGRDTIQPLRGLVAAGGGGASAEHAAFKRIKTLADLDRELAAASAAGRAAMLDFYADWCVSCKEMERYTFSDPAVVAEMDRFVLLQADVTANDAEDQALMQERFGLIGPPAMLFFDSDGNELSGLRLVGFVPADSFAAHLRKVAP